MAAAHRTTDMRISERHISYVIFTVLLTVGVVRIVATYKVFNQTYDEPYHVAAGMEWWDRAQYRYERLHPPLARIFIAALPYLDGLHSLGHPILVDEGNAILHSGNTYVRNLTLARIGVLPFFVLASIVVWVWSRSLFGNTTAFLATLLFTMLPPILAHSSLATTDMAVTASFALLLYTLTRWLQVPTTTRTMALGASMGLAILSKFTALYFLPGCILCLAILWEIGRSRCKHREETAQVQTYLRPLATSVLLSMLVVWAGYRFSVAPPMKAGGLSQNIIARTFGNHEVLRRTATTICATPLPLSGFIAGLGSAWDRNKEGQQSFLLGRYSDHGWWYFFPVVLVVKTPLAFLILFAVGTIFLARTKSLSIWRWTPLLCATAILLVCLPAKLNMGIRHILPIYPMLAIVAGFGATALLRLSPAFKVLAALLLVWAISSSALAHPDYLPYFNELAGSHPENILAESDLDWGQDLNRLSIELKARGVREVALSYFGSADPAYFDMPKIHPLAPYQPRTGWIAISIFNLKACCAATPAAFSWLAADKPVAKVGKSIFLYNLPQYTAATATK